MITMRRGQKIRCIKEHPNLELNQIYIIRNGLINSWVQVEGKSLLLQVEFFENVDPMTLPHIAKATYGDSTTKYIVSSCCKDHVFASEVSVTAPISIGNMFCQVAPGKAYTMEEMAQNPTFHPTCSKCLKELEVVLPIPEHKG